MRLYLRKNDLSQNEKLPYFTLFMVEDGADGSDKGEFTEVGALWKSKSGNGYSGMTSNGIDITMDESKAYKKEAPAD